MTMLGIRDDEAVVIVLTTGFSAIALLALIRAWAKSRTERVALLRQALEHPALDDETKRQLIVTLAGHRWSGLFHPKALVALAWIGIFIGIGCLVSGDRDAEAAGPIIALISFGVLTVPFALRELEARTKQAMSRGPR